MRFAAHTCSRCYQLCAYRGMCDDCMITWVEDMAEIGIRSPTDTALQRIRNSIQRITNRRKNASRR